LKEEDKRKNNTHSRGKAQRIQGAVNMLQKKSVNFIHWRTSKSEVKISWNVTSNWHLHL